MSETSQACIDVRARGLHRSSSREPQPQRRRYIERLSMTNLSISLCVLALSSTGLVGCDLFRHEPEGPVEQIGAAIDDSAEDIEDGVEDVAEEVDESVH